MQKNLLAFFFVFFFALPVVFTYASPAGGGNAAPQPVSKPPISTEEVSSTPLESSETTILPPEPKIIPSIPDHKNLSETLILYIALSISTLVNMFAICLLVSFRKRR